MKKRLLCITCLVFSLLYVQTAISQIKGNPKPNAASPQTPGIDKSSQTKLSSDLKKLYEDRTPGNARTLKAKTVPHNDDMSRFMQIRGSMVVVDITIKRNMNAARAELEKMGFKVSSVFGRVISGMMPINAIPQLENAANVRFARPAYQPMHQSAYMNSSFYGKPGSGITPVISQGDTAQRSYLARMLPSKHPITGKGVTVGILSDSYNNLGSADVGVAHGELPGPKNPFGYNKPVKVLKDLESDGTDEGRAMAEIVHDVAPGADLAFHSANFGQADFANGILRLANVGCKVIVDDVVYFAEPFFQDGIIAQAVDIAKQKKGVTYFSSAGNRSIRSYESDYRATNIAPFGAEFGTAHNFSKPGDPIRILQPIFIPTNGVFRASFQWDEPFFSAGGLATRSDLDIYLLDQNLNIVAIGGSDNLKSGDPVEVFGFFNNTPGNVFFLVITKFAGPDPNVLKYIFFGDALFFLTDPEIPGILAPTLAGHSKAEGAIATGAAFYLNTPAYGLDTPQVEFFSSVGGVANYFDKEGNRIPALVRNKPEIVAPDGGNTSFFDPFGDGDIVEDSDKFPNFFGTSAAAPHAAGVAALMIDAQKLKTLTPGQIKGILQANTVDMDNVFTDGFDKGFDFNTGTGLIKADAAVKTVAFPNLFVKDLRLEPLCSNDPSTTRNWKVVNPNPFEMQVRWLVLGNLQVGSLIAPPGQTTFSTKTAFFQGKQLQNVTLIEWEDNFGFPRFDIEASTRSACGQKLLTESSGGTTEEAAVERLDKSAIAEVYPNPSPKSFRLYLSLSNAKNTQLELFNIEGKKLYKRTVSSNGAYDIDATTYKPGIYILQVRQGSFNKTIRLIKQ